MEIKIDNRNELFKRQELVLELDSEKNPSFEETKKKLAEKLSKPEENIDVYRIKGNFGKNKFKIEANVYDSREDLENIKKLEITSKQRKEGKKEETSEGKIEESGSETEVVSDEVKEETKSDSAPVEDKIPEKEPDKKPEEAPVEERKEEEQKAIKEEIQQEEEAKE